jgi:hypothetical protein
LVPSLAITSVATAQPIFTLDVGGARIRYADTLSTNAFALTPALQLDGDLTWLRAAGTFSRLGGIGWTGQGELDGALTSPSVGPLAFEIAGSAGGSTHEDGTRTGQALGLARVHLLQSSYGAWIGGGGGGTWDGGSWRTVRQAEAAAWANFAATSALFTVSPTEVEDTLDYVDTQLSLGWENGRFELDARAGFRSGKRLPALGGTARSWGGVDLTVWVKPWAAVVASGGTYPVDFTQGFPGGNYALLGVRIRPPTGRKDTPTFVVESPGATGSGAVIAFETVSAGGCCTIRVHAPAATRVEITGDPTHWQPMAMKAAGRDWWTVTLPLSTGAYQMNVRVNGGEWLVPPGLTPLKDEFGGTTGLLVVR